MSTFERYCIYFLVITFMILGFILINMKLEDGKIISTFAIFMSLTLSLFSVLMALVFSYYATNINIEMSVNCRDYIENIAITELRRTEITECNGKKYFCMKGKINSWLTNPVVLYEEDNKLYISIPKGKIEKIMQTYPSSVIIRK